MKTKRFKWELKANVKYSSQQMIGLAKAMSKTDARIVYWEEGVNAHIIFKIKENYPIFQKQLESYLIIVKELKGTLNNRKR